MIWGLPTAWWLMALAGPLIGLFFYRRRAVLTEIPSIEFWEADTFPISGRPFGRKLRHLMTLLVQLLVLTLLVAALADPHIPDRQSRHQILVIDCSATMQTETMQTAEGSTRLHAALETARQMIADAPEGVRFTIVRVGQYPEVITADESDHVRAAARLDQIEPADLDTDLRAALAMLHEREEPDSDQAICLISDFCGQDVADLSSEYPEVVFRQVGSAQPNAGIVDLRMSAPHGEVVVMVGRNQPAIADIKLTVTTGQEMVVQQRATMKDRTTEVRMPLLLQPGEAFKVRLAPADALVLDNIAYGIYPAAERPLVRLVSPGHLFLEQAIQARKDVHFERVDPAEWRNQPDATVTVLDGPYLDGLEQLSGRFIIFSPQSDREHNPRDLTVRYWLPDHAVIRAVEPTGWGYLRGNRAAVLPEGRTIVAAEDGPLVYEWFKGGSDGHAPALNRESGIQAVVFNFDLSASELPFMPAFPVLLWDTIDYLSGAEEAPDGPARPTGSVISRKASVHADSPEITGPDGTGRMLRMGDRFIWSETERQGVYSISTAGTLSQSALNWMSLRSTADVVPLELEAKIEEPALLVRSGLSRIDWRMLVMVVALVMVVEWFLFHGRILKMEESCG